MLSMALIPPVALAGRKYGRFLQEQQKLVQESLGEATSVAEEAIAQVRTVRAFASELPVARRFAERVDAAYIRARDVGYVEITLSILK